MKTISSIREMQNLSDALRKEGKRIGFVPTMGYLHEGHLALVRKARELADVVVVSIFVNPLQFGPKEDFSRYPRDFKRDAELLEKEGTDVIFSPTGEEMYPKGFSTHVQVRGLEDNLCGRTRKGHFVGVATVVAKLFAIVKPHFAVFGRKDFQQLVIIERMVRDLNMDLAIVPYPTVREEGGLAMSSRNIYLSPAEREEALALFASILRSQELVKSGERDGGRLKAEALRILTSQEGISVEYAGIYDPETLEEVESIENGAVYAMAVRIGNTRLIDNATLEV